MNKAALFCDGTEGYVYPPEPKENELVTFRFRTAKDDADRVGLVTSADTYVMEKECTQGEFDYYTFETRLGEEPFRYCFEVQSGTEKYYYGRCGISREILEYYNFVVVPGFSTPDWAKGAVMYQIFTDRFYNGDKSNDVETNEYYYIGDYSRRVTNWDKYPANMGVREFYGGDLQGVMDKLDYLQELGVEVVYFNPLFVSPSNHKYDIQDYDYIDPHYGKIVDDGGEVLPNGVTDNSQATKYKKRTTGLKNLEASNELFIKLVEELHRRGMKVILDGVFNHCGSFNKWMDRERIYEGEKDYEPGAYISADSPYRSYFRFFKEEPENWPYNGNYDGWWGHDTLPKLNYEDSVKLENYILYIGRKWVSPPYNVDGWRLDVAADLGRSNEYNHDFWKKFRTAVKDANPNALILAEHYGDPSDWLKGDEWDTVMNYDAFMEPISWFLTGLEKHSDQYRQDLKGNAECFRDSMRYNGSRFYAPSLLTAMNELDNHDHSRFLTRTNSRVGRINTVGARAAEEGINKAILREAVAIQMTWPGAPTVYYGDEAGVCGFTDPDNRRTYPWGHEDQYLVQFYRDAIRMHRELPVLKYGSVKMLKEDYNLISFGRFNENEQVVVVINNNNENKKVEIPVWETGISRSVDATMTRILDSNAIAYDMEQKEYPVVAGYLELEMSPLEAIVLCRGCELPQKKDEEAAEKEGDASTVLNN